MLIEVFHESNTVETNLRERRNCKIVLIVKSYVGIQTVSCVRQGSAMGRQKGKDC